MKLPATIWSLPEFRSFIVSQAAYILASRALAVVIGYQIYEITKDPLALGYLGLVEAIPALSLALYGGYVADRNSRRLLVLVTRFVSVACAVMFAVLALSSPQLWSLLLIIFIAGIARGFADPATAALEAQVVPKEFVLIGSSWLGSVSQACSILGPTLGGIAYAYLGVGTTYWVIAGLFLTAWSLMFLIAPKPKPLTREGESMWQSIRLGLRYVLSNQIIIGSMSLDLFAVLFGGAMALLPIFANDILKVGPQGFGLLHAAPSVGALLVMLWATRHPPSKHAGRTLLFCVAGFGISIIVFALSKNFYLSLLALMFSGLFDGMSMVIRRSIIRIMSPEHMRGRIAAAAGMFIGASNELGAFESGVAAKLFGVTRAVWLGGIITLLVVTVTSIKAPQLRKLDLEHPPSVE
jgi:MFS family permease